MINTKLEEFKKYIKGRKVAFLGIGISNIPAIKYLNKLGANIVAFDKKEKEQLGDTFLDLTSLGIDLSLGEQYMDRLTGFDIIFRSPSIRPDIREILEEVNRGAILTSEIEMVMEMCPGKIIGVTGSGGKTTTTTLIYEMIKAQELECYVGGNIGIPLLDKIEEMTESTIVVLELSSFQLMTMRISPHIAVLTSLSPDHLDVHTSIEEYYDSKKNIYKYQTVKDHLVLNYDDILVRELAKEADASVKFYSSKEKLKEGLMVDDGKIKVSQDKIRKHILDAKDVKVFGKHNLENICAAMLAVENLVSLENMCNVAKSFQGVEHRMEIVANKNGVTYINNSIASSPIKSITSLNSFDEKVILIAGGFERNIELEDFAKAIINKVKVLILLGQTRERLKSSVMKELKPNDDLKIIECNSLENCVNEAKKHSKELDVVILSPGFASFDMYKKFEERGNHFKEIVRKI